MQSDVNSFGEDVVLDSFNMTYTSRIFIKKIKIFKCDLNECIYNEIHNKKELIKLSFNATVVLVCIFFKCYEELKSS